MTSLAACTTLRDFRKDRDWNCRTECRSEVLIVSSPTRQNPEKATSNIVWNNKIYVIGSMMVRLKASTNLCRASDRQPYVRFRAEPALNSLDLVYNKCFGGIRERSNFMDIAQGWNVRRDGRRYQILGRSKGPKKYYITDTQKLWESCAINLFVSLLVAGFFSKGH